MMKEREPFQYTREDINNDHGSNNPIDEEELEGEEFEEEDLKDDDSVYDPDEDDPDGGRTDSNGSPECENCGDPNIEEGYKFPLCRECREVLAKRPIPNWVKAFAVFTLLVFVFALFRFPVTIQNGLAYEQAAKAESEKKYITAMRSYERIVQHYPNSSIVLGKLFLSQYKNGLINEAYTTFEKIAGKGPRDEDLVNTVNQTIERMDILYMPGEELYELLMAHMNDSPEQLIPLLQQYLDKNPNDVFGSYYLANLLFDSKKFEQAETVMDTMIPSNQDFMDGVLFLGVIYREQKKYEQAVDQCNQVLNDNIENANAYATLSKIELKRKNNQKGLEYARKAYELMGDNSNIVANLALAYHYNNMIEERNRTFDEFKLFNDNNTYQLNFLNDVFSGGLQWQDV